MDFSAFLAEVVGVIRSVWPEIPGMDASPRRIFTSIQAERQSFVESARSGKLALPCVVVEIGEETHDPGWGVNSNVFRAPITVHYIDNDGAKQSAVHAKLAVLAAAIDDPAANFVSFQSPPERASIDSSEKSPINAVLLGVSGVKILAGHVRWFPGLMVER